MRTQTEPGQRDHCRKHRNRMKYRSDQQATHHLQQQNTNTHFILLKVTEALHPFWVPQILWTGCRRWRTPNQSSVNQTKEKLEYFCALDRTQVKFLCHPLAYPDWGLPLGGNDFAAESPALLGTNATAFGDSFTPACPFLLFSAAAAFASRGDREAIGGEVSLPTRHARRSPGS